MINIENLPTHVARVVARLNVIGPDASADTFLATSYIAESLIKTVAVVLCAGVRHVAPSTAYRLEYDLVRGDGLGTWEQVIATASSQSYAGYVPQDMHQLVAWLNKKRTRGDDEWARNAVSDCSYLLGLLGADDTDVPNTYNVRHLFSQLVRIRNKTKAHGAVGPDFFAAANPRYISAVNLLLENCPIRSWDWIYLAIRSDKGDIRAIRLGGTKPEFTRIDSAGVSVPRESGVHFRTHERGILFGCAGLLRANRECTTFSIPNGGYGDTGRAEFIDYATGITEGFDVSTYLNPPAPLPRSATQGADALDVYSSVFGNLPPVPSEYVERLQLQKELTTRLLDKNHVILTLHGRGGIGKTSLALFIAHKLADEGGAPFDHVIWLSARDLELKPAGATEVCRAVSNLQSVCRLIGKMLSIDETPDAFAELLQDPRKINSDGILFVFDNFETLDDPRGLHKFLDTHTHIPNKILITSRERAFKGDYPIEVGGMEYAEASTLLKRLSLSLGVELFLTEGRIDEIIEYTDAHAYVMRVLIGEIAKERAWVSLPMLVPRRSDLLNAIFERSFNKLTDAGRWVFLAVGNWRSIVPELGLLVVLGLRDIDVEAGVEECLRLSLINRHELADSQFAYSVPELAHLFAKKKLDGDPDRLLIQEDRDLLMQFGPLRSTDVGAQSSDALVERFFRWCLDSASKSDAARVGKIDEVLARICEIQPSGWLKLAEFRRNTMAPSEDVSYCLRRAVEEMPSNKDAWVERAYFAKTTGDERTHIASLVGAVDADPKDAKLVRDVAKELATYIDHHKTDIPTARRGVYLASVRAHMERLSDRLDATGLSRLAWLFLLEGKVDRSWEYVKLGLKRDAKDQHCQRLAERLRRQEKCR